VLIRFLFEIISLDFSLPSTIHCLSDSMVYNSYERNIRKFILLQIEWRLMQLSDKLETYRHWRLEQDGDRIVWLTFDHAGRNVNTLSRSALDELAVVLDALSKQPASGMVIRSGKRNGFIAGADISEFTNLTDADQALAFMEHGQGILGRLEQLPFPTVSLIHGFCLGGGLELALACRFRIAADTKETRLGLPEVKLGIHPGFGGTVRLTRLIGPLPALNLLLTGRHMDAGEARRIGLVDKVVSEARLDDAARAIVKHPPAPMKPGLIERFYGTRFIRPLVADYLRLKIAKTTERRHYPAPFSIIDLWERFGGGQAAMLREEALSIARLIIGKSAKNLIRVFFLRERLRSMGRSGTPAPRCIHLVGAGAIGGDIAAWCALQGIQVTIQDLDQRQLTNAVRYATALFRENLRDGQQVKAALDRLVPDMSGDGIGQADMVVEAIFEDAPLKIELYRRIEPRMMKETILASCTACIPLEKLSGALERPERLLGLRFFNPMAKMELVEVVRGSKTCDEAVAKALAFVTAIGRLPLPVDGPPGSLVNRILLPYLMEAVLMELEGILPAEIDRVAMEFGMTIGPILLADTIGLDNCISVARTIAGHSEEAATKRLEELITAGHMGIKNGRGFYRYENGKPLYHDKKSKVPPAADLEERLILRLLNAAVAVLREKVTVDADLVDAGIIFGAGFAPFRGGPLHYIGSEGADRVHGRLKALEERFGSRFAPDAGWSKLMMPGCNQNE
jgi:3-hydroxyacyl-CoA dehydrogenase/enoyl-CoA hydratase/3-hydroxybutyryl-CoA epimerase